MFISNAISDHEISFEIKYTIHHNFRLKLENIKHIELQPKLPAFLEKKECRGPECLHAAIVWPMFQFQQPEVIENVEDAFITHDLEKISKGNYDLLFDSNINTTGASAADLQWTFVLTKIVLTKFSAIKQFTVGISPLCCDLTSTTFYKVSYVQSQHKELGKPKKATLIIMDVFRGQITDDVISFLRDNNIHYVLIANNMTQLFQPRDLMVNMHCKSYLKRLFSEWYAQQIEN